MHRNFEVMRYGSQNMYATDIRHSTCMQSYSQLS